MNFWQREGSGRDGAVFGCFVFGHPRYSPKVWEQGKQHAPERGEDSCAWGRGAQHSAEHSTVRVRPGAACESYVIWGRSIYASPISSSTKGKKNSKTHSCGVQKNL